MALALAGGRRKSRSKLSRSSDDYERDRTYSISSTAATAKSAPSPINSRVQSNKWYKEPRIPIHMNMSTMIRMKSKEGKFCAEERPDWSSSVGLLYADDDRKKLKVFSPPTPPPTCNRRMFDYMQSKFDHVVKDEKFFGSTYTKNLFWRMVAEHESRYDVSAKACGDGAASTYQRVAAINVQTVASGCNLQYIEKISIHSKTKRRDDQSVRDRRQIRGDRGASETTGCEDGLENLSVSRPSDRGAGESGGDRHHTEGKKKTRKSSRKPVVVTCLKNTSIKYVRK